MRIAGYRVVLVAGAVATVAFPVAMVLVGERDFAADVLAPGLLPLAYYLAGAVAFVRRPANAACGRLMAIGSAHLSAYALAPLAALAARAGWSAAWVPNLAGWLLYALGFSAFVGLFAVFPDGRPERRYERLAGRLAPALWTALAGLGFLARAAPPLVVGGLRPATTPNPLHVGALDGLRGLEQVVAVAPLVAIVLFALRYRRAGEPAREQMRWPLAVMLAAAVTLVLHVALRDVLPGSVRDGAFVAVFALLPVAMVVGMLRRRLFDVELVLRRSAVFGSLWAVIALVYAGLAAVLGLAAGSRLPVGVAVLVTIVAAMAFDPARRRLERVADRLVFGERRSGYDAIRELGARLEHTPALDALPAVIADTVRDGLGAEWARVTLAGEAGDGAPAALSTELAHAGERVGRIACGPKRDGAYDAADQELLAALGRQATLAIRNGRLAFDLAQRLAEVERQAAELRTSRRRIVQAAEAERRRIERDIHDGIQQEIVALMARVELARTQLQLDPARVEQTLDGARDLIHRTQADLRELARGIHPAVLGDRGLVEAIAGRSARLPLAVEIEADGLEDVRFAPEVEGAAYFVISEALANVMKHAGAERAAVRLTSVAGGLDVEVADRGRGFDPDRAEGSGLEGLRDRVQALGGSLELISAPGEGTRVVARLLTRERQRG
jgi:signal transduction histidine kinase